MKRSILWNGFELKKGEISTKIGEVPYIAYTPERTDQVVNIAIHGEGHEKEDWLCFNSVLKLGNLLKESIKSNSAFIAFDLYGHGEWVINNKNFNIYNLSESDKEELIEKSSIAIEEAIPILLKDENLEDNKLAITAFSLGCSVALGIRTANPNLKTVLISPYPADIRSNCKHYCVIRGSKDAQISTAEFQDIYNKLPKGTILESFDSEHEVPVSWIHHAKEFIYTSV
ncbi:MAG: hypothetical protein JXR64_03090 [Spirochaetales bacterium]|nr:hypothetical protein [Spirochaetales bacterium]